MVHEHLITKKDFIRIRMALGLVQKELAAELKTHTRTIAAIESGERPPSRTLRIALVEFIDKHKHKLDIPLNQAEATLLTGYRMLPDLLRHSIDSIIHHVHPDHKPPGQHSPPGDSKPKRRPPSRK